MLLLSEGLGIRMRRDIIHFGFWISSVQRLLSHTLLINAGLREHFLESLLLLIPLFLLALLHFR